jgi:protease II
VENGRVEYLFSYLSLDRSEGTLAVMLDLLGTKKEYCLLVKNLALPDSKPRPIFNVRPQAVFSADGQRVCYVQRSPEGGWVELVYRSVQSCWAKPGEVMAGREG